MGAGLAHHAVGLGLRLGEHPIGFRARVAQQRLRLGVGAGDRGVGVLFGLVEQRVSCVQDVLSIVELTGDRVLDVVDQFQHITARDDAAGGHRHTAGLFDYRAQLVERFKYSVHGATLQLVG